MNFKRTGDTKDALQIGRKELFRDQKFFEKEVSKLLEVTWLESWWELDLRTPFYFRFKIDQNIRLKKYSGSDKKIIDFYFKWFEKNTPFKIKEIRIIVWGLEDEFEIYFK